MASRREVLRNLGAVGAAAALGRWSGPAPAFARPRPAGQEDLAARLAAAIEKHRVPGASAAVYRDGRWEIAAAGVTNVTTGVEVTPETVMHIGSITKVINATLIMQLVDEGRIQLESPLKRYLPDFRVADADATERITVEMLLNHTSGIDGELFPDAGPDRERVADAIPRIARQGQLHAPGAELSYCNAAVVLAGYLAERLLDTSWYTLIEERIFAPLELPHAVVQPADALLHRASVGHFLDPATGTNTRTGFAFLPVSFAPAGATAMLSARDLGVFALTHLNDGLAPNGHRLLSAESARRMRRQTAAWRGVGFGGIGLGWITLGGGIVGHTGGGPGIVSSVYADPERKSLVVVLTNAAHGGATLNEISVPLFEAAGAEPLGLDAVALAKQATDDPVDPAPYAGSYETIASATRIVPHGNGIAARLRSKARYYDNISLEETPPVPLRPIRDGHFALGPSVVTFLNPDARGRMQHLASGGRLLKRMT
ncbi:MAG: serine hydrolase domain-containing protein [Gemmatimonadales bacterium]